MDRNKMIALMIRGAYQKTVRTRFGGHSNAPAPTSGVMLTNALSFFDMSQRLRRSLDELMQDAFMYWSEDFCRKIYKRPWPPLNVVLGQKTRQVIDKKVTRAPMATRENLDQFLSLLEGMDKKDAVACIDAGWPEGPKHIRKKLKERLLCPTQ